MTVLPAAIADAKPDVAIVATPVFEEDHDACAVMSAVDPSA
jgi:uncharacterized protein YggE